MKINDRQRLILLLFGNVILWMLIFTLSWSVCQAFANDGDKEAADSKMRIHAAAQAVDEAWEEFHRSAIEGTLASPRIQTQIEQQLHEARGLLMKARKARRNRDYTSVNSITERVINLTTTIVASSRERKP